MNYLSAEELQKKYFLSSQVTSPKDLKKLNLLKLKQLAEEYRDYLIEVCSRNGGHLGPSLGVVELTLALHKVFDSPQDKIIWDIGHQAYPHKLITGRFEQFQTLRQEGGISGFCRRVESEHDIMGAGHAGTSLSTAVGIAEGYRRNKKPHKIIAVIGDAGLTAGMAYEALHQEVAYKKNLIVILNDNQMSISPNVGAVNAFLSRQMTSPFLHKIQEDIRRSISKIPLVGAETVDVLKRIKYTLKNFVIPTVFFESFGFHYYGPFDGHDLNGLIQTFENIKSLNHPILVHVITEKGRGYAPALADKVTFHGCGPYDRTTGKMIQGKPTPVPIYSTVFAQSLLMMAKQDPKVSAITAAMPTGTGLHLFQEALPQQFYDVGISEQHAVTFAAGLAIEGFKPYVAIYSTFLQRAYDQIIHDVCIQNLNVKFCMDRSGFVGADGATHHGNYDLAYLRAIPNMSICAPKDERELQELLWAMSKHVGPAAVRFPRGNGPGVALHKTLSDIPEIPWGKGEIIYGEGKGADMVFVALGTMVPPAVKVAESLKKKGFSAMVVNARFVKPLDEDLLRSVALGCPKIMTLEEHVLAGGFGAAIMEFYMKENLLSQLEIKCLAIPDHFFDQASHDSLRKQVGLDPVSIEKVAQDWLQAQTAHQAVG